MPEYSFLAQISHRIPAADDVKRTVTICNPTAGLTQCQLRTAPISPPMCQRPIGLCSPPQRPYDALAT